MKCWDRKKIDTSNSGGRLDVTHYASPPFLFLATRHHQSSRGRWPRVKAPFMEKFLRYNPNIKTFVIIPRYFQVGALGNAFFRSGVGQCGKKKTKTTTTTTTLSALLGKNPVAISQFSRWVTQIFCWICISSTRRNMSTRKVHHGCGKATLECLALEKLLSGIIYLALEVFKFTHLSNMSCGWTFVEKKASES